MESASAGPVEFRWKLNEDSLANNPFFLHSSTSLTFVLRPPHRKIKMSFGAGAWSPREVQKLVNYLVSLEIESPAQKIRMDSLPQLRDFLLARRRSIGGACIHLLAAE